MKVLVVSTETPVPATSGTRLRVLHLSRALATAMDVELAVLGDPPPAGAREPFAVTTAGDQQPRGASLLRSLRRPYAAVRHDVPELAAYAAGAACDTGQAETPWLLAAALRTRRPVIMDAHNVEAGIVRSLAREDDRPIHRARWAFETVKTERWERAAARAASAVSVTSDAEAAAFEAMGAREIVVVPNGVDVAGTPFALPGPGARFVYTGHFGYRPNALAGAELATEVFPRLRARLPGAAVALVGKEPPAELLGLARDGVEVTGEVPSVLPYLRAARATIIPLRTGAGTRLKVLEAMAAGVPVISTRFGVEGLAVRDGEDVLLAETPDELADAAARVAGDDALCRRLAERGRALVHARYGWPAVAQPLVDWHLRNGGGG